jgi:hypothetical protein
MRKMGKMRKTLTERTTGYHFSERTMCFDRVATEK